MLYQQSKLSFLKYWIYFLSVDWSIFSPLTFPSHHLVPRTRRHENSVKKPAEVVETAPRSSLDSLDNNSSSSVRIQKHTHPLHTPSTKARTHMQSSPVSLCVTASIIREGYITVRCCYVTNRLYDSSPVRLQCSLHSRKQKEMRRLHYL